MDYLSRGTFAAWIEEPCPETGKRIVGRVAGSVSKSQEAKQAAVIDLCIREEGAHVVAQKIGVNRSTLYNWKNKLLGREVPASMKGAALVRDYRCRQEPVEIRDFNGICLTTKRRPRALLLGDHLKLMNLNLGKQPLRIRRKFLSSLAVQMSFAGNFIIECVEDYIDSRLTFVLRRVPRQRSSFPSYELGLPV